MEPEGSLPHSQVPATFPCPVPVRSSPYPTSHFLKILILILSSHLCLGLPSGLFPSDFPTKTLYMPDLSPIRATCPANLIHLHFITQKVLGEQYRSLSCSLCSFLHSLVTSSLLGPNMLLNTLISNTLSLSSSLIVSDQVSHPYKATGKIVLLLKFNKLQFLWQYKTQNLQLELSVKFFSGIYFYKSVHIILGNTCLEVHDELQMIYTVLTSCAMLSTVFNIFDIYENLWSALYSRLQVINCHHVYKFIVI